MTPPFGMSMAASGSSPAVTASGTDPLTLSNPVFQFIGNDITQADGVDISNWNTRVSPGTANLDSSSSGMQANTSILPGFKVAERANAANARQLVSTDSAYSPLSGNVTATLTYTRIAGVFQSHIWVYDAGADTCVKYIDGSAVTSPVSMGGTGLNAANRLEFGTTNTSAQGLMYYGAMGGNQTPFSATQALAVHQWLVAEYT